MEDLSLGIILAERINFWIVFLSTLQTLLDHYTFYDLSYAWYFLSKIVALCPPKPKEFDKAALTTLLRLLFGT